MCAVTPSLYIHSSHCKHRSQTCGEDVVLWSTYGEPVALSHFYIYISGQTLRIRGTRLRGRVERERGEEGELKALAASKKHPVTLMFDRTAEVTCPLIINAAIHTRRATAAADGSLWSDDDPVWPRDYNLTQISRNDTFTVCWVAEIIRRKRSSASFNEYRKSLVYDVLELRCFLVTSPSPINGLRKSCFFIPTIGVNNCQLVGTRQRCL